MNTTERTVPVSCDKCGHGEVVATTIVGTFRKLFTLTCPSCREVLAEERFERSAVTGFACGPGVAARLVIPSWRRLPEAGAALPSSGPRDDQHHQGDGGRPPQDVECEPEPAEQQDQQDQQNQEEHVKGSTQ